ncbi:MAG: exonuclease SbcCD subunit D [Methanosarcinales archaeon]|nr:exonuclease SbcCD subunit D [Methanosarcinales archaeon]
MKNNYDQHIEITIQYIPAKSTEFNKDVYKAWNMNFIHMADVHLGYAQYNLPERFRDFAKSFSHVIEYADEHDVDFVLIAGDLFHKRNINAATYMQAHKTLDRLVSGRRAQGKTPIPVYIIEGNHDLAYTKDGMGWLNTLNYEGLVKLIRPKQCQLDIGIDADADTPTNASIEIMGDFIDLESVRIFGMKYIGASTRHEIERIAHEIHTVNEVMGKKYTILMMHFGMEGILSHAASGELSYTTIHPLNDVVDYLALGHYHNAYDFDNWVFNPGSVDLVSMSEHGYPKGFYHVTDDGVHLESVPTRPVIRKRYNTDGIKTPDDLYIALESMFAQDKQNNQNNINDKNDTHNDNADAPLVEVALSGTLSFPKTDIDFERIEQLAYRYYNALRTDVKVYKTNDEYGVSESTVSGMSRKEVELKVLHEQVMLDTRYRHRSDMVTDMLIETKEMVSQKASSDAIMEKLKEVFKQVDDGAGADAAESVDIQFGRG